MAWSQSNTYHLLTQSVLSKYLLLEKLLKLFELNNIEMVVRPYHVEGYIHLLGHSLKRPSKTRDQISREQLSLAPRDHQIRGKHSFFDHDILSRRDRQSHNTWKIDGYPEAPQQQKFSNNCGMRVVKFFEAFFTDANAMRRNDDQ